MIRDSKSVSSFSPFYFSKWMQIEGRMGKPITCLLSRLAEAGYGLQGDRYLRRVATGRTHIAVEFAAPRTNASRSDFSGEPRFGQLGRSPNRAFDIATGVDRQR